jgi:hypothetical protein
MATATLPSSPSFPQFLMAWSVLDQFCCAGVADFAGLCRNLQSVRPDFLCFQSLGKDSGSAYRGSNPWGAAKLYDAFPHLDLSRRSPV